MKLGLNPRTLVVRWTKTWPQNVRATLGPAGDWLDMMLVDHGFIREMHLNLHRVSGDMWRSAQPGPGAIRMLARRGFKTIINLRGARDCGSYILEVQECRKNGLVLIDAPFDSRAAPTPTRVARAAEIFATIQYPALMHCKSGADRAGIASALYLLLHEHKSLDEARQQLSLLYGHVRSARTGVLDHFLDAYEIDHARTGRLLLEWVSSGDYDATELTAHFRTNVMANVLVDQILRRE